MIPKKLSRSIAAIILIMLTITSTVYAEPQRQQKVPYGPRVVNLRGKDEILRIFQQIKSLRSGLININITESTTEEDLDEIYRQLEIFLAQFDVIKNNIERYKITYRDSFEDIFFAERLNFIIDSFRLSIIGQLNLIRGLKTDRVTAVRLFHSHYLIPTYYYLIVGDHVVAYIETYFVIT